MPCVASLPRHIGVIMDGNGRWAKKRLLPRSVGHRYGMDRMMGLLRHALDVGVNYVTVYALSTENFSRPQKELDCLFDLIRNHFVPCMREIAERKARVRVIGDLSLFPSDVQKLLLQAQEESAMYEGRGKRGARLRFPRGNRAGGGKSGGKSEKRGQSGYRTGYFRISLHGGAARSRSHHPHGKRAPAFQLPALARRLCGTVFFR